MNTKEPIDYTENAIKVFNAFLKSKFKQIEQVEKE